MQGQLLDNKLLVHKKQHDRLPNFSVMIANYSWLHKLLKELYRYKFSIDKIGKLLSRKKLKYFNLSGYNLPT